MISYVANLVRKSLFLAAAFFALPIWLLSSVDALVWPLFWGPLFVIRFPGVLIVGSLGYFLVWSVGLDWNQNEMEIWQYLTANCTFYYLVILLIMYKLKRKKEIVDKLA